MRILILFFCLSGFLSPLFAQDELADLKIAVEHAERTGIDDSIAEAYCSLGQYYVYRSSDTARYWFEKSLKKLKTKQPPIYPGILVNLAETYFASGDMDEAMKRFQFCRDESIRLKDTAILANCFSSMGIIYRRREMPDSTLICYNRALELLEGRDADWDMIANLLGNICVLYGNTSRLEESVLYGRRAVEAAAKSGDIDMILYANYTCGSVLFLQKKYEEGIAMVRFVLEEGKRQKMPKFALKGIVTMLQMFSKIDRRDSVNYYMREAENILPQLPENSVEVLGYREMQSVLLTQMERYRESLDIQKSLLKYRAENAPTPINKLYLEMARNYQGLKDYSRAADHYERALELSDSLYAEQVQEELSDMTAKYETKEKELEIIRLNQEHLEQEARMMRWVITTLVFAFALVTFVLYYIFRRKRMQKEQEFRLAQSYIDGLERERTRLAKELHDGVCNDLLGIGMQMQCMPPTDESKQELLGLLEQVRGDVRCISHELMPPKFQNVTLAEAAEAYVEQLIIPSSMQLAFSQDSEGVEWRQLPEQLAYEVYRILQEILSNIVKHSGATEVSVKLYLEAGRLSLLVEDNRPDRPDTVQTGKGIGLTTTQERAKAIGGVISTESRDGKQLFKLEISLNIE